MHILQVIAGLHKIGGTTTFVGGLANALARLENEVTIATYRKRNPDDEYPLDPQVKVAAVAEIEKGSQQFDVVHVHGLWDCDVFWASGWALKHGIPLVWSPHGMLAPWSLKHRWWKKFLPWHLYLKRRLKKAAAIHVTAALEKKWIEDLGFGPVVVAPLGTEESLKVREEEGLKVRRFESSKVREGESSKVREFESLKVREFRVLFVGRVHPVKGLENLVRAVEKVRKKESLKVRKFEGSKVLGVEEDSKVREFEGLKVRIVGSDDGNHLAELKKLADDLGVADRFEWVGPKYGPDLSAEYDNCDVFVLPSFTENFGGVVVDALAHGKPVIASKFTPWQELENVEGLQGEDKSKLEVEGEEEGRGNRSTVEFGNQSISRRALAEKKVDEWLRGVTRESFVSALGKLVEEKTAAGEYRFRRPDERDLALKGAERFYDEFSRKIIPLSDGRCVYFAPDVRSRVRNGNDLSRCWAEYAFHAVSNGGRRIAGKEYNERWYHPHKASNFSQIVQTVTKERCYVRLRDNSRNDSILFYGEVVSGLSFDVVTRLDEFGNIGANLTEVTIEVSSRGEKKPPRLVPLTEAVQTVVHHQTTAGSYPSDTRNISNSLDLCNGLPSCVGNRAGLMNSEDQQRGETPDPNSEKGRNEAVGVREASGETLVKPLCQPSELTQFVALEPGDTFDQIEQYLRQRVAERFENKTLGISASIGSKRNANELAKHMAAGESPEVHKFAAKNIGALFERGVVGFTHLDKKAMPDQRWITRFVRVLSLFVFGGERFIATLTLKAERAGGRLYAVEAVEINQDVKLRSTPRGAISKDLNSAPILNLTSQLTSRIAYYVGDVKRTHPAFLGRSEPFSIERAADLIRRGGDDKSKLGVEGEEEGRGNRSTVESTSAPSGALPSGGSDRVAEILSEGRFDGEVLASTERTGSHHCRPRPLPLTSSRCGFWVSNDPETLAKTLVEAMSLSDAERRQMGEAGRRVVETKYTWSAVAKKMIECYESLKV